MSGDPAQLTERWLQATWETDAAGAILGDSPSWSAFTGQSVDEWLRYGWIEMVHPDDRVAVGAAWRKAILARIGLDVEFRIRTRDDGWTWTNARAIPVRSPAGDVEKWVGVNIDVNRRRSAEAALREAEERYRLVVDGAVDYIVITVDLSGTIRSWSPGAAAAFGWSAASACGRPFSAICRRVARLASSAESRRDAAGNSDASYALPAWYLRHDGSKIYLEGASCVLRESGDGQPIVIVVARDATAQRQVEEALRSTEVRYRGLIEGVRDHAVFLCDANGIIVEWTAAAKEVTGYAAADVVGSHVAMLYPQEAIDADEVGAELLEAAMSGKIEREGWRRRKDGSTYRCQEVTTSVRDRDGALIGFGKISRDLTTMRRAELAEEREERRVAADVHRAELAAVERDERRRLARDLHDTAGQHVTALALGLRALEDRLAGDADVRERVRTLSDLAATLGAELHDVATRLRPRTLDDFGLAEAIGATVAAWSRDHGIPVDVHVNAGDDRLPGAVEDTLFRTVQEALTNVVRHSGARHVGIAIERPHGAVIAVIEDDGRGFEVSERDESGLGLLGIRERAASLGGTVEIESAPDRGTTLLVRLPLRDASPGERRAFPDGVLRLTR